MPDQAGEAGPDVRNVVLVLAQSDGGIGRHVRALAAGLPGRGIRVTVCAPPETLAALALDQLAVPVVAAPIGRPGPVALRATRRALRRLAEDADVVHAHGLRAGAACVAFTRNTPLVVTWHNAPLGGRPWRAAHSGLARYVAGATDLTLAASDDLADAARAAGALQVRSAFVAAPPLPSPVRGRVELRAELGLADRPIVLGIGRLHRQKRWDVLVEAAAGWSGGGWAGPGKAPYVVIAGEGPERADLSAQIAARQAPVRLLGFRSDVAELLAAADVVALPSEWEARALVAQEALRAGVPLVTTRTGGLDSLVTGAAVIVPVGDAGALRDAIASVLTDARRRNALIAAGLARAKGWPDETAALDELVANYREVLRRIRMQ